MNILFYLASVKLEKIFVLQNFMQIYSTSPVAMFHFKVL